MLRSNTPGCQSRASPHSPHSGESRNPSHPLSQGDFTPLHVHGGPPSKPTLHQRDLRHTKPRGRCGGSIGRVKTPPASTTNTAKRDMRLKSTRFHGQANMPHCVGHPLIQLAKRVHVSLKTDPDHLRAAPPPSLAECPRPANAQIKRANFCDRLPKGIKQRRGLALRKLSQESQCDVHGVRRHPPNIVFGVQRPEFTNRLAKPGPNALWWNDGNEGAKRRWGRDVRCHVRNAPIRSKNSSALCCKTRSISADVSLASSRY